MQLLARILILAGFLAAQLAVAAAGATQAPNFVVILGEGHGWSSTSVQMDDTVPDSRSSFIRTPTLEKLAAQGMRFANFYAPSPRCTPSRAALLTGKSPARLHMTFVGEGKRDSGTVPNARLITPAATLELPTGETTIAGLLKTAGYATAHFGKWHLGRVSPGRHGFDENDGANDNGGPDNVANPHPRQLYAATARGIDFMTRQAKAGKPFYLQISHYAARQGGAASPEALATVKSWGGDLSPRQLEEAAADYDLDLALNRLLTRLDDLGLAQTTYVIFTTDHGTPGRNPPLAGGKGTLSEGGLRVPCIIRGPGIQAGCCSHVRGIGEDLFPTIADLAHISGSLPGQLDGGSLVPVLTHAGQGTVTRSNEAFVVHFPHYDKDPLGPASAIWLGDFKLIRAYETGAFSLYNIAKDPGERNNLARELPEKVKQLDRLLASFLASIRADLPRPNPNFQSSLPAATRQGGKRRSSQ